MRPFARQFVRRPRRRGFTLVELLVVISIMLVLTVMTIGAVNLSVTSERVRSGARQVQSVIEGAHDRAIYAGQPRGIRLLVNEDILDDAFTPPVPTVVSSLVYLASGTDGSQEDRNDRDGDTLVDELYRYVQFPHQSTLDGMSVQPNDPIRRAIIGVNTNWTGLYEAGILGPGSFIQIRDHANLGTQKTYRIDPNSFPIKRDSDPYVAGGYGGMDGGPFPASGFQANGRNDFTQPMPSFTSDEILYLAPTQGLTVAPPPPLTVKPPTNTSWPWNPDVSNRWEYSLPAPGTVLSGGVLPGEKASLLPRNVCIDLQTSHLPPGWVTYNPGTKNLQYARALDIMFSPGGEVVGDAGAAGIIHLHVCDVGDAMAGTLPGSPTKPDGTPREGDEFGITIFTGSGRVIVHPMDLAGYPVPGDQVANFGFADAADLDGNPATKGYWQPNTAYSKNNIVAPRLYNGLVYRCVTPGTSANNPPSPANGNPWSPVAGGQTTDGSVVWVGVKHDVWNFGEEGAVAK